MSQDAAMHAPDERYCAAHLVSRWKDFQDGRSPFRFDSSCITPRVDYLHVSSRAGRLGIFASVSSHFVSIQKYRFLGGAWEKICVKAGISTMF